MKKRLFMLILAAVFTGASLTSCSLFDKYKINYDQDEDEDEDEDDNESNEDGEEETNIPDAKTQIAILAENSNVWFGNDFSDMYSYCVTDLDSNGRLEVIVSGIGGTGYFSYGSIYEINEAFDGIVECGVNGSLEVDITSYDLLDCFIDKSSGKAYYGVYDYVRNGWAEQAHISCALSLENGAYEVIPVASCIILTDDVEYEETYYYYDADDNEVDKDYFDNCYDIVFEGYEKKTASLCWQSAEKIPYDEMTEDSGLYLMPEYDELTALLTESYAGFTVE